MSTSYPIHALAMAVKQARAYWQAFNDQGLGDFDFSFQPLSLKESQALRVWIKCRGCERRYEQYVKADEVLDEAPAPAQMPRTLFYRPLVSLAIAHCSHAFDRVEVHTDWMGDDTFATAVKLAFLGD